MRLRIPELAAVALFVSAGADAATVTDAWFRALPAGLPSGGYFTLTNSGAQTISLTAADSPACGMLMLHKSSADSGMSMMSDVAKIDVPAGGAVKFAPGGYHLMCMDPTPQMKPGAKVPVTLFFADKSKLQISFTVRNASGR
ncbi:MAG TPA: copper chaperone PCu(A)C [Rhizomicrobium sp.]|jgi:copper(I)-binding protein|nr:copper chaperone PCu(A)C [Rhizomicrobium sp.]